MFEKKIEYNFYTFSPHTEQKEEESRSIYSFQDSVLTWLLRENLGIVSGCSVTWNRILMYSHSWSAWTLTFAGGQLSHRNGGGLSVLLTSTMMKPSVLSGILPSVKHIIILTCSLWLKVGNELVNELTGTAVYYIMRMFLFPLHTPAIPLETPFKMLVCSNTAEQSNRAPLSFSLSLSFFSLSSSLSRSLSLSVSVSSLSLCLCVCLSV